MKISVFALYMALVTLLWLQQGNTAPLGVDDGVSSLPNVETEKPKSADPTLSMSPSQQPTNFTEDDLKQNARLADMVLGHALQAQNWGLIQHILSFYADIPQHDPLMILYMQGALDRVQGKYKLAISNYRSMFQQAPELHNVEFDLAVMLYEDKQYKESRQILQGLIDNKNFTDENIRKYTELYLTKLNKDSSIQTIMELGYKYNDNVNGASDGKILHLWGMDFIKNSDSLPQADQALTYSIGFTQDFNIFSHHYLGYEIQNNGDYYAEQEDWREHDFSLKLPYKYQSNRAWLNLSPQFYQQWLEGNRYRSMQGIGVDIGRWVKPRWQSMLNYVWLEKKYSNKELELYNGDLHVLSFTNAYIYKPDLVLVSTLSTQKDQLNSKDESSNKYGLGLGLIKSFDWGSIRLNGNYNYRKFDDNNLWMLVDEKEVIRKDHEIQLNLNLSLKKYEILDFIPKINYQYLKIDSNIPSFYSRNNHQVTLSFERTF